MAFAAPYPGKILPMHLAKLGGELICQKDSFLCAAKGVSIGIAFQKKIGVGLFGGEGFIMQRLEGDGLVFVHAGGTDARATTCSPARRCAWTPAAWWRCSPAVDYDIQFVGGIKTALFGGEGLFFATLTGPGQVWLQSLPFSRLADRIYKAARNRQGRQGGRLDPRRARPGRHDRKRLIRTRAGAPRAAPPSRPSMKGPEPAALRPRSPP